VTGIELDVDVEYFLLYCTIGLPTVQFTGGRKMERFFNGMSVLALPCFLALILWSEEIREFNSYLHDGMLIVIFAPLIYHYLRRPKRSS